MSDASPVRVRLGHRLVANPIPTLWGMVTATVLVVQILFGIWLDSHYDRAVRGYALWLSLYPLLYWAMPAVVSPRSTGIGFARRPGGPVTWASRRYAGSGSPPEP